MKKLLTLTALGTIMMVTNAQASGFNLKEQSVSALGNAFAGATAGAEDISYSYYNAAGLTRHKGTKLVVGGTYIAPRSKAREATASPSAGNPIVDNERYNTNIVHAAVAPNMYISHQIDDKWTVGASLNVPFGMITKYDDEWAGRYHGTLSKLTTVTVTPMAAYKATDELSLGAGLQMQYIKARLRNSAVTGSGAALDDRATLEGDTFDIGYQVGALYEFNDATRIGAAYRSEVKHKLKGDLSFDINPMLNQDIGARLTTPANFTMGIYHDLNDKWSIMGEYGRTFWSSFDELRIVGKKQGPLNVTSVTEEHWKDTSFWAAGVSYKVNGQWKIRAGIAYDQGAVNEEYRTPRIPDAGRQWYSTGVQYIQNEKFTWNLGYTYIRAKDGRVNLRGDHQGDASRGSLKALYKNDIHILGLSMSYNF